MVDIRQGSVDLLLLVDENGKPTDMQVSEYPGKLFFGIEVEKVVGQWLFTPALLNGKPIKTWLNMHFKFEEQIGYSKTNPLNLFPEYYAEPHSWFHVKKQATPLEVFQPPIIHSIRWPVRPDVHGDPPIKRHEVQVEDTTSKAK